MCLLPDRIHTKVLHFDGTSLCLYVKGLERRRFAARSGGSWPPARRRSPSASSICFSMAAPSWAVCHPRRLRSRSFRLPRIAGDDLLHGIVVSLAERDVDTLRQISLLLERENQRLIAKNPQLNAELARLRGLPDVAQLKFAAEQTRAAIAQSSCAASVQSLSLNPIWGLTRRRRGCPPGPDHVRFMAETVGPSANGPTVCRDPVDLVVSVSPEVTRRLAQDGTRHT